MKTLPFADELIEHPFAGYNSYSFSSLVHTSVGFNGHDNHELFIAKAGLFDADNIVISTTPALNGRALNNARVAEILNGAKLPMAIDLRNVRFYVGKGIVGTLISNNFRVLLAACIPKSLDIRRATMKDIRFYVDKDAVKSEGFAAIRTVLKEVLSGHPGEILYTEQMKKYFTKFQFIPDTLRTMPEVQAFKNDLITKSLKKAIDEVESLQLLG